MNKDIEQPTSVEMLINIQCLISLTNVINFQVPFRSDMWTHIRISCHLKLTPTSLYL